MCIFMVCGQCTVQYPIKVFTSWFTQTGLAKCYTDHARNKIRGHAVEVQVNLKELL